MLRRSLTIAAIGLSALVAAPAAQAAVDASGTAGAVRFVKRMDSSFDRHVTNISSSQKQWLNDKFWRMEVFSPFFDARNAWYGKGWVYSDIYAIYTGSSLASQRQDWILKDTSGNKLFIPWGCSNGSCPQYAADITNPEFRANWIQTLKSTLARGYKGAWIDDVNLELRVGNGNGATVRPYSPSLGRVMSDDDWRKAMATFVEEVRRAIPDKELLHNSIWYAGQGAGRHANAEVKRQIAAADYINLERGFTDGGLTGGNGEWSVREVHRYVDAVHAQGKGVIVDSHEGNDAAREYSLANYLLISTGADGVGDMSQTPDNWWKGWDTDLGRATGTRQEWKGLITRDFEQGMALVNVPQSGTVTVTLPRPMVTIDGRTVTQLTLAAGRGAVLRNAPGSAPAPTPAPEPTPTPAPQPTPAPEPTPTPAPAPAPQPAPTPAPQPAPQPTPTPTPTKPNCRLVKVTYITTTWDSKRRRFVKTTRTAQVCVTTRAKTGSKRYKAAVKVAKNRAAKADRAKAKAARKAQVQAAAAKKAARRAAA